MQRLTSLYRDERGQALVMVVFLICILTIMAGILMDASLSSGKRSAAAVQSEASHAAAEAAIDDYLSKLLDDNQYFLHYVAPGESTRKSTTGALVSPVNPPASPTPWPSAYGRTWTYPTQDTWFPIGTGYAYNLQVQPPQTGTNLSNSVDIVATGAYCGTPCTTPSTQNRRVIEELVRPASVADFQMMANNNISYGSSATTNGKIYAGCTPLPACSTKYSVNHQGTANADIYAEGNVTGNPTLGHDANGVTAKTYNSSNIRTVIKQPIDFTAFQSSLTDIQRAAQYAGGIYLNNPAVNAWWMTFKSDGTIDIKQCTGSSIELTAPTCGAATNYPAPGNGAIYAEQSVIVAGGSASCGSPAIIGSCVKGRMTVASNNDIVIGNNIDYVTSGTDTLGLIAKNDMIVAKWAPTNLNWRAATIAQSGSWYSATSDGSHGTMTFTGSTATYGGGYMDEFTTRFYNYDATLSYLQPPWFPTIGAAYTVILYRELPAG